jgi:hypothetical protein
MAVTYHGKNSAFKFSSGDSARATNWTLTETVDIIPITSVSDDVERFAGGLKDFTISAQRNATTGASFFSFLGTSASAICYINPSRYITAVCKMSQFTETVSISDRATESFQFQGSAVATPAHT